jgi:hypothetical protein
MSSDSELVDASSDCALHAPAPVARRKRGRIEEARRKGRRDMRRDSGKGGALQGRRRM